ncbi:MAG: phosphoenolpyruvate carboxykinase (ATP) [Armatimonadetes bacterium]|nr:phosphoenolpyruvate carboxykinase (ATP) [Armatimonadota bacterium]
MLRSCRVWRWGLEHHGITHTGRVFWNLTTAHLYEEAVRRGEGDVAHGGPLAVKTGFHTGRSQHDKFVVDEPSTSDDVWWGSINVKFSSAEFDRVHERVVAYLQHKDLYVQDLTANADPRYRLNVRFVCELAWHNLFVRSLFRRPLAAALPDIVPDFTVVCVPHFHAVKEVDRTRSDTFVLVNLAKRLVLIGGTAYAGEMKKSIFTYLNYLLPHTRNVLSMHCSANYGTDRDVALFFGLSGTGKTTLSADPKRVLIGDDEHGWSDEGVFNFEYGCYAKVIHLSEEYEPQIWSAVNRFGSVIENVVIDPDTRMVNYEDDTLTENTRAAYPLVNVPNTDLSGVCGHPRNIVFLTCDAFGVMPPISRLEPAQAMYHFLSGYTARVAGAVRSDNPNEKAGPQATFSACFGAPFMVLRPAVYAKMLGERIARHNVRCWLVNTGWSGGPAGAEEGVPAGARVKIPYTRAMVNAALDGSLEGVEFRRHPVFNVDVPVSVPGVPAELLDPRGTWADGEKYDQHARQVAAMFANNFRAFEADVPAEVCAAGPRAD